jgi:hypothetical protein
MHARVCVRGGLFARVHSVISIKVLTYNTVIGFNSLCQKVNLIGASTHDKCFINMIKANNVLVR